MLFYLLLKRKTKKQRLREIFFLDYGPFLCNLCVKKDWLHKVGTNWSCFNRNFLCFFLLNCSPDPTVQDIRDKILNPSTRIKKSEDSKPGPSNPPPAFINLEETEDNLVPLPARRKQRSLSSLVGQPKALNQTVTTGRNMTLEKAGKRYPSRGSSLWIKEPTEEDVRRRSSPPLSLRKFTQPRKKVIKKFMDWLFGFTLWVAG